MTCHESTRRTGMSDTPPKTPGGEHIFPLQEADRCVMCGMCLAHCPTYLKHREEGESPRGRIALMVALASQRLAPSPNLHIHLDQCLVCRACERVCPSKVPYGRLIDAGRALTRPTLLRRLLRITLLDGLIAHPHWLQRFAGLLYRLQQWGLIHPLARLVGLQRLAALLPKLSAPTPLQPHYPARGIERGRVALFVGCVTGVLDRETIASALQVLTQLGFSVDVPPKQTCCGALHQHNGALVGAERLLQQNQAAFSGTQWDAILSVASGCGATLAEYPAGASAPPVMDISDFLSRASWPEGVQLRTLEKRVVVHDPCSLVNVLRQAAGPYAVLRRIPGLTVLPLGGNHQCCGGAGSALLTASSLTRALQADKVAALREMNADFLVSSNLGCVLHLAEGARAAQISVEVMHPVTLLARCLEDGRGVT